MSTARWIVRQGAAVDPSFASDPVDATCRSSPFKGVGDGVGAGDGVPLGVAVGVEVAVGAGVDVGVDVAVGFGLGVGVGLAVGFGLGRRRMTSCDPASIWSPCPISAKRSVECSVDVATSAAGSSAVTIGGKAGAARLSTASAAISRQPKSLGRRSRAAGSDWQRVRDMGVDRVETEPKGMAADGRSTRSSSTLPRSERGEEVPPAPRP